MTIGSDGASEVTSARDFCSGLEKNYAADPASAVYDFIKQSSSRDYIVAVQVYRPKFQHALDLIPWVIPSDRGLAIATTPSVIGADAQVIAAGTYKTTRAPTDCYYEVNDQHGAVSYNNFVSSAPGGITVTLRAGQGFDSQGCGTWIKQ